MNHYIFLSYICIGVVNTICLIFFFSGKHLHEEFLFMKPRYILFRRMYWSVRNTITLLYSAMPIFIVVTWGKVKSTYSLPSNNLKIVQWIEKKFNEWKMLKYNVYGFYKYLVNTMIPNTKILSNFTTFAACLIIYRIFCSHFTIVIVSAIFTFCTKVL